ncbi:MAG TPA: pectin acetylesterase-family hydrolase, partial [Polyangiaceae bacterium]|nr:pectin acetylesterase-family hydrolase [Polyangiaceae bacterium]
MRRHAFALGLVTLVGCGSSSGGATAGSGDAGGTDAARTDASSPNDSGIPLGAPITAPADQWTFVPFSNAFCGNGASTGIGINPHAGATRVLVYLEGGGACWSELTCYTTMTAAYFTTGYSAQDFATESTDTTNLAQPGGFFDRTASANPFKDYSFVYVPYCTGDIHAGNNVATYGTNMGHHVGYANMTAYLSRIVPTFPGMQRVVLAGSSAGGYGALFNWWQTQQAFGSVRVDLIDDSGTFLPRDVEMLGSMGDIEATWR